MSTRLPKEAYTTSDWFEKERQAVFGHAWTFVGALQDFAEAGDFRTVTCGANRLFVVRDKEGRLKAFHNICRHRGAELLDGQTGNCGGALVCPYHRWTYGLDGALRGVPNRQECFPDLDRSGLGLLSAAVGVFKDLIFVNPDADADFETWIAPLAGKQWPHDLTASDIKSAVPLVYDMKCDWKVYVENAIDGYHLDHLHPNTLNMYNHKKQSNRHVGRHWVFWEPLADWYQKDMKNLAPYGLIDHIPEGKLGAYLYHLFPSVLITETEGSWSTLQFIPIAPDHTIVEVRTRVMPMTTSQFTSQSIKSWMAWGRRLSNGSTNDGSDDNMATEDDALYSGDFMQEDIFACEQQQKAMSSPLYSTGPAARDEESIFRFHEAILQYCPLEEWESKR